MKIGEHLLTIDEAATGSRRWSPHAPPAARRRAGPGKDLTPPRIRRPRPSPPRQPATGSRRRPQLRSSRRLRAGQSAPQPPAQAATTVAAASEPDTPLPTPTMSTLRAMVTIEAPRAGRPRHAASGPRAGRRSASRFRNAVPAAASRPTTCRRSSARSTTGRAVQRRSARCRRQRCRRSIGLGRSSASR